MAKMRNYKFWTKQETDLLKQGIQPKGRTIRACINFAKRFNIKFSAKLCKVNTELIKDNQHKPKL